MKITAIKAQVKRQGRYSVFVDGEYRFSLSDTALLQQKLVVGQELSAEDVHRLQDISNEDKAYSQVLRYVSLRPRSVGELRTYFARKKYPPELQEQIISKLTEYGYVDDRAFAQSWVASRRLLKHTSRRRLELELRQKFVADDIISEVLSEEDTSDEVALKELVARKRKQTKYQDHVKLMQYLARQGFQYDDIKRVLAEDTE